MNWNGLLDRLRERGFDTVEETYMDHYGKVLAAQRPEFQGRYFRCSYGVVQCNGLRIETYLFPSEGELNDFMEVIGGDPWWVSCNNLILHFPESDPAIIGNILEAIS